MEVSVYTHPEFERKFKQYKNKYHSLVADYRVFLEKIKENPFQGKELGRGLRKVRFGIADKGGGKSGGMRVITFSINRINEDNVEVTLLYIYDKSEMGNVSDKFLFYLLNH